MTDDANDPGEATLFPKTVGERLRDARVALKLELTDVAQRTRVPLRHLQAIEDGDYSSMPTSTYAIGFAKAYARAVGEDEVEIAREVRGRPETAVPRRPEYQGYDIEEAPRIPSLGVMIGALVVALALLVGALAWYNKAWFFSDASSADPAAAPGVAAEPTAAPAATPAANGQVTLIATDQVWVRVYDASNTTLKQGTMAAGERFDVPANATGAMINVGRPDKLQVLVNGTLVAPLGDGRVAVKDIGISAAALAARNLPAPDAAGTVIPATTERSAPGAAASPAAGATTGTARPIPPFFREPTSQSTQTTPAETTQAPGNAR